MSSGGVRGYHDAEASDASGMIPGRKQVSNGFGPERPWLANTRATRRGCPLDPAVAARPVADSPPTRAVGRSATMWCNHRLCLTQRHCLDHRRRGRSRRVEPARASAWDPATERRCTHGNSPAHSWTRRRFHLRVSARRSPSGEARPDVGAFQPRRRMDCFIAIVSLASSGTPRHARLGPGGFGSHQGGRRVFAGQAACCSPFTHFGKDST